MNPMEVHRGLEMGDVSSIILSGKTLPDMSSSLEEA